MRRGDFLKGSLALAVLGWDGCATAGTPGETLPPWEEGNLDLHFIYTGCGENIFYRLPDGTAVLNDVGEAYRPKCLDVCPLLPSPDRLGGDWVTRYLKRIYPEKVIDYAIFSHWHEDHVGHAHFGDRPKTPNDDFRYRVAPDGTRVCGFTCVAQEFGIRRLYDHQFPLRGTYNSHGTAMRCVDDWLKTSRAKDVVHEPFVVGALDQIRLQRHPERYAGIFSVRNIAANGVVWDGANGTLDLAGEHVRVTGAKTVEQNVLSAMFLIRYGKFSYFASGDMEHMKFRRADGSSVDFEETLGKLVGPVTVCKAGHHGCRSSNGRKFVDLVRADAYVACMWDSEQMHPDGLERMHSVRSAASDRRPLLLPQLLMPRQKKWFSDHGIVLPYPDAVHVVVRVSPGGENYRVYLLDARDEQMRVVAKFSRIAG